MARTDSTLGMRFAQSKFSAKTYNYNSAESSKLKLEPSLPSFFDNTLPGSLETLRSHVNYLLSLPLPVRDRRRLIMNYWELEFLIEEPRLLLDQVSGDPLLDFLDQLRLL